LRKLERAAPPVGLHLPESGAGGQTAWLYWVPRNVSSRGKLDQLPSVVVVDATAAFRRSGIRLDKGLFQQLASYRWIAEHRGLLVTGPCGVGKSWLSCALAQKACRDGYTVYYARVPRLFADLDLAQRIGQIPPCQPAMRLVGRL
jgi:DNA replication protein DnaC